MSSHEQLINAILEGNRDNAVRAAGLLLANGATAGSIVAEGIEAAMKRLDLKCTAEQFNLLEIMLSGRAVMGVIDVLYPPGSPPRDSKGTIVLCTIQGDVHDLGKNIVKIVLAGSGYRVVDIGRDCPIELMVEAVSRESALVLGVSSLITTTSGRVREVKGRLLESGLGDTKVLVGGAALKQATPEELNVDYVAQSAFDGLHFIEGLAVRRTVS